MKPKPARSCLQRLNKFIAASGVCSRRQADNLIRSGKVAINGQTVTQLGTQVDPRHMRITVCGKPLAREQKVYILLHKPRGYITTSRDPHAKKTVFDLLPKSPVRLFPVGRLDKDTAGLLLLTNDGALSNALTHPKFEIEREYEVCVRGRPAPAALAKIEGGGIPIENYRSPACNVQVVAAGTASTRLRLILKEGKKREIRHMFAAIGHPVITLKRIRFGKLQLGRLAAGDWKYLQRRQIM